MADCSRRVIMVSMVEERDEHGVVWHHVVEVIWKLID